MTPPPENTASEVGQVIIEMIPQGHYVKVVAFHVASLIEVSLVGDPRQPESTLRRLALHKMRFVLEKKGLLIHQKTGEQKMDRSPCAKASRGGSRGWVV